MSSKNNNRSNGNKNSRSSQNFDANNYVKKSGAQLSTWAQKETGEQMEVVTAWNGSKAGFLSLKAYPLTDKGCQKIAEVKGYSKDYGFKTSNGNERWFYTAEFTKTGEKAKIYYKGVAIFVRNKKKLYVPRFGMVANCNPTRFGKGSFTKSHV